MHLNEYQERAARVLGESDGMDDLALLCKTAMIEEAGEALGCYKKLLWRQAEGEKPKLMLELGDLMFYLAAYFTSRGAQLQEIMAHPASGLVCNGFGVDVRKRIVNLVRLAMMFESGDTRTHTLGWAMVAEVQAIGLCFGWTLDQILQGNLDKLARRFKGRFTREEAAAKADTMSPVELKLREQVAALRAELDGLRVAQ